MFDLQNIARRHNSFLTVVSGVTRKDWAKMFKVVPAVRTRNNELITAK